jgi:hypothetical protein
VTVLETMEQTLSELPGLPDGGGTLVASPRTHGRLILRDVRPVRGGVDLGDIVLGAGLTISGRVTLPDGAPATAYVWASCGETGLAAGGAETDAEGRFVLRGLCPGPYLVTASDRFSHDPETGRTAEIADVAAGTENLDLALRCHPKLTIGLVSAETGGWAWVLKLEVRATLRGTARTVSQTLESPRKLRLKDTTLVLEVAGEYEVSVNTPGCPEQSLQVTLGPEEWKTVAVRLPRVE